MGSILSAQEKYQTRSRTWINKQTYRKLRDETYDIAIKDGKGADFFQDIIAISSVAKR